MKQDMSKLFEQPPSDVLDAFEQDVCMFVLNDIPVYRQVSEALSRFCHSVIIDQLVTDMISQKTFWTQE